MTNQHQQVSANPSPDWTILLSPQAAEKELIDFKWDGPGVYRRGEDSLLVIPNGREPHAMWNHEAGEDEVFLFCIYNSRNIVDAVNLLANCPTRGV